MLMKPRLTAALAVLFVLALSLSMSVKADTVGSMTAPTTNNDFTWIWGYDGSGQLRAIKVDASGAIISRPTVPTVTYSDASVIPTAATWTLLSDPTVHTARQGYRIFNPSGGTEYITYTSTSSPPTGTPSTTTISTPGAEPIGAGGGVLSDAHDVPAGYIWVYCPSALQPVTWKEW